MLYGLWSHVMVTVQFLIQYTTETNATKNRISESLSCTAEMEAQTERAHKVTFIRITEANV